MRPYLRVADIPPCLLPTGVRCSTLPLAPRPHTHNTTTSAKLTPSRPKDYLRAAPVEFGHSACIRLAAAPSRPLFLAVTNGSRCSTPTPRSQTRPTRLDGRNDLVARAIRHHSKHDKGFLPLLGAQASTNTDKTTACS
jgi:hypothetical protein